MSPYKALAVSAAATLLLLFQYPPLLAKAGIPHPAPVRTDLAQGLPGGTGSSLYPDNVDCRDFDKTRPGTWSLRKRSSIDLGNWDRAFDISGNIEPRTFVRNGIDLYSVLESRCGISVHRRQTNQEHTQGLFVSEVRQAL